MKQKTKDTSLTTLATLALGTSGTLLLAEQYLAGIGVGLFGAGLLYLKYHLRQ